MFRYETHLHTYPVSRCAQVGVKETLKFYKDIEYQGVFITNHFLDGNINIDGELPYEEKIEFYFSDFEEGKKFGKEIGLDVFCGVEMSYKGTDFLIFGLDKKWWTEHPEIMLMKKSDQLPVLAENGALVIQAHPFRNPSYLDHIRLFPDQVHGVEIINSCNDELSNKMAGIYAENYNLLPFAGTDNHIGSRKTSLSGVETFRPVEDEKDFVDMILSKEYKIFSEQKRDS